MWNKSVQEVIEKLNSSFNGLTSKEASQRLTLNGKNEIPKGKKKTVLDILIEQFKSPIIFILMIAAIFSVLTHSTADCIFILIVIGINAIIGTYQEWNSEKSAEKLQNMIRIKTRVIRNGMPEEVDSENIVVGDIVDLESGNKIPADLRLIETKSLSIDESVLTGETEPKNKISDPLEEQTELAERLNIAYAGTVITNGRGKGIVIATGKDTEFGKVAENVLLAEDTKSPLVLKMEKFSKQISIGFIILAVVLSIILYLKKYTISEIFSVVIALTISAIPEGLTIAMTIVLSIASIKMAKKKVIIKKLNAVESLGSCTVIATDKTGTLTANEQTAKKIVLPTGKTAYIRGIGYNDVGEVEYEEGLKEEIQNIAMMGVINNEAILKLEEEKWVHSGDAMDTAFLALGLKMSISSIPDTCFRIAYEPVLKYSAVFFKKEEKTYVTVKGAPEKILDFCDYMMIDGKEEKVDKEQIMRQNEALAKEGYRVIGIAELTKKGKKEKGEYTEKDIKGLTFLGLVGFVDPIREGVVEAIERCQTAGIKTIMITGDQKNTAEAIGKRLKIDKIYARVTPMEKLQIVNELKEKDELVAVTGDGVNDIPALKAANIGVAMGSGTDIAKETGNMIIADDNFSTIVKGVEEGRKAYNNIRKVIYLLLSTGFSEIILFVLSILCNLPIPLIAIQLLWLNLISNGIQGDALAFEEDVEDVTKKKVKKQTIFDKLMIKEIAISSIVMAIIEFVFYVYLYKVKNYDIVLIRTYLLTLMVFMENIQIFNCRSERISMFKISGRNNRFLIFSIVITSLIQLMIIRVEPIANFFQLTTIPIESAGLLFLLTIPLIVVMESFKKRLSVTIHD